MSAKNINVVIKKINWQKLEEEFQSLNSKLYPARKLGVEKLKNQRAKLASMATGLLLQDIVKNELGIKPENLVIGKGEYGKPYVEGHPEFNFNISHSGNMVVVAYGDSPVGIDVEGIRYRENDLKVAKRCFMPEEYAFITSEEFDVDLEGISHSVEEKFFMVWTMKEAYLKYKGTGISVSMKSFQVNPYEGVVVGEKLSCQTLIIDEYVYAVCVDENVEINMNFQ
ncbi:MAG: 4'-phosphopantetheinyl transferase superfamily protein [Lachnospiraceae bacterium]|nr:4'-phosphopantetheinyl transferase superfamily protein [Lachnospiraceae bacterium]